MKRFFQYFEETITAFLLAIMSIFILLDVFSRSFLNISSAHVEELSIIFFIYIVFLGSAAGTKRNEHICVDTIFRFFPDKTQKIVSIFGDFLNVIFFGWLTYSGTKLVLCQKCFTSPSFEISLSVFSIPLPISSALMAIYTMKKLYLTISKKNII
jgi:TRAP-type C4-dicarboxylate transport system permease small subunit